MIVTTDFYVFRHSETERNALGSEIQGWINDEAAQLNETGKNKAHQLGEALGEFAPAATAIYTSDLGRSYETAEIVANYFQGQIPIYADERLREKCHGKWDTLSPTIRNGYCLEYYKINAEELGNKNDRFAKWKIEPLSLGEIEPVLPECQDELESIYDVWTRGTACFKELGEKHRGETLLISSHGAFNDIMATEAESRETNDLLPVYFEPKARKFPKNCSVYHFQWNSSEQKLYFLEEINLDSTAKSQK